MGNSYLYIDGMTLWLIVVLYIFIAVCIVFWGMDYVKLIRKLDRLQVKYNKCRADLSAAQMELQGMKLRQAGIVSDSKPPMQKTPSVNSVDSSLDEGATSKAECPYKVEPGSGE